MALIKCPECKRDFSEYASACPNCGCPIDVAKKIKIKDETQSDEVVPEQENNTTPLMEMTEGEKALDSAIAIFLLIVGVVTLPVVGIFFICAAVALMPIDYILKKWDSVSDKNPRKLRRLAVMAFIIIAILVVSISNRFSTSDTNDLEKSTDNSSEEQVGEEKQSEIIKYESYDMVLENGYVYIKPEDLSVYCSNLEGVKI